VLLLQMLKTEKDKEETKHEEELREVIEKQAKEMQDLGLLWTQAHVLFFLFFLS